MVQLSELNKFNNGSGDVLERSNSIVGDITYSLSNILSSTR